MGAAAFRSLGCDVVIGHLTAGVLSSLERKTQVLRTGISTEEVSFAPEDADDRDRLVEVVTELETMLVMAPLAGEPIRQAQT